MMNAFAESLEIEWKREGIPVLTVMTTDHNNIEDGQVCSHTPAMYKSRSLTSFKIFQCLYVDDGAFPFDTREDMIKGMSLIYHHFARFGLEMHIGRNGKESKTECVFFPPPQFITTKETQQSTINNTIPTNPTSTLTANPSTNLPTNSPTIESPTTETPTNIPTDFPTNSRINIINHPKHGSKHGIVRGHTNKYVIVETSNMNTTIRILPKFLQLRTNTTTQAFIPSSERTSTNQQLSIPKRIKKKKPDEPNDEDTERKHSIYDNLDETKDFPVADGFISFTRTFKYLGSLITYNLRDDEDIKARTAAANASMGALKEIWSNPNLDTYSKYLLFRAIPINLLLWGCETWSLRQSLLDKLEAFMHKSIRRILKISMTQVKDMRIRNETVRNTFYAMPCVKNMIAARQLDFIGIVIRGPHNQPARRMITSCCNETRRVGRPQTTGKNFIVKNLQLLFKDVPLTHINHFGPSSIRFTKPQTKNIGAN
jgi:hypothetical protein